MAAGFSTLLGSAMVAVAMTTPQGAAADLDGAKPDPTADQVPPPPTISSILPGAVADGLDICGWSPRAEASGDENGLDLALLLARNSRCRNGSMGCAIASEQGEIISGHVNGPLWGSLNAKNPSSDVHAEVNAVGHCARRGMVTQGATVYITMPPCKRCFTVLVAAGIKRIVTRKEPAVQEAKDIKPAARREGITFVVVEDTEARRAAIQALVAPTKRKQAPADETEVTPEPCKPKLSSDDATDQQPEDKTVADA